MVNMILKSEGNIFKKHRSKFYFFILSYSCKLSFVMILYLVPPPSTLWLMVSSTLQWKGSPRKAVLRGRDTRDAHLHRAGRALEHLVVVADWYRLLALIKCTLMSELLWMCKCHFRSVLFSQANSNDFGGPTPVVSLPMASDLGSDLHLTLSCRSKPNQWGEDETGNEWSVQQVSPAENAPQVETV